MTGRCQMGSNDLKLASLRRDKVLVAEDGRVAFAIVAPTPTWPATSYSATRCLVDADEAEFLFKS